MAENRILHALPPAERSALERQLGAVELKQHDVLCRLREPIRHIYFVQSGLVSLLNLSKDGEEIEAGIIGAEGVVGGLTLLAIPHSMTQITVQISGRGLRMPTERFVDACAVMPELKRLVSFHIQILLFQAQQNATCHALHTVEARLCRWMLQARDVMQTNVLNLTQEFLSHMLGTQRTSVSMTAHTLQHAGFIRYSRGRVEILDPHGLEEASCECYRLIKQETDSLLPPASLARPGA